MTAIVSRSSTGLRFAKDAGIGVEIAPGNDTSFFVDARYLRINPSQRKFDFIPISFGLRF